MLDFTKTNKRFLAVRLIDNQTICVRMPTKRVFDALNGLTARLETLIADETGQLDEIYDLIAAILSNNLEHKPISSEELAGLFDIEDVQTFFESYMAFMTVGLSDPNSKSPRSPAMASSPATDA